MKNTQENSEFCPGCEHLLSRHYKDVKDVVRCLHVIRGESTRGVIGLPYEISCDCKNYMCKSEREKPHDVLTLAARICGVPLKAIKTSKEDIEQAYAKRIRHFLRASKS